MNNLKTIDSPIIQEFGLPGIAHIAPQEAWDALKFHEAILLDVREDHECAIETIDYDATVYQPMSSIMDHLQELSKLKPLIVASNDGMRSVKVVNLLKRQGFEHAVNLDGGIIAWKKKNLPIDSIFDGESCHECHGDCKTCK